MSIPLLLAVLLVPIVAVVTLLVVLGRSVATGQDRTGPELSARLDGGRRWLRTAGLVAGLVAAGVVVQTGSLGIGLLLAPPVAALGLLLGILAAELSVRPPAGPRRTASLGTRRGGDYLPRRLTTVVATTGAALAAVTATTTALASPDDMGRAGRWLSAACSPVSSASRGPFPGSYYTVPLLVVVAVGVLLALVVLRATVARPPLQRDDAADDGALAADLELRAQAARAVVAGLGVLFALPLGGVSALAAMGLAGMQGCGPAWWPWAAVALLVVAVLAGVVLVWCTAVALLGRHQPVALQTRGAAG